VLLDPIEYPLQLHPGSFLADDRSAKTVYQPDPKPGCIHKISEGPLSSSLELRRFGVGPHPNRAGDETAEWKGRTLALQRQAEVRTTSIHPQIIQESQVFLQS
jgi:hypothetical protein